MRDRPSFASSETGSSLDACECLGAGELLPVQLGPALADQRERQVRERREVAGGTDGAPARHDRGHTAVQAGEKELDGLRTRARVPLRQRVRPQEHCGPHNLARVRVPTPHA